MRTPLIWWFIINKELLYILILKKKFEDYQASFIDDIYVILFLKVISPKSHKTK